MNEGRVVLGYWNIRGLAERIRHLLEYTGLPYDQIIYDEDQPNKWFNDDKPRLIKTNPAITLPYLTDGDKVIT